MRIEYRRKYPYFGKYKIKISIYNRAWDRSEEIKCQKQVEAYLAETYNPKEYKWSGGWNVYLNNQTILYDIHMKFPDYICYASKPAPGYEDLEGTEENIERVLWYDKYPYKVILAVDRINYFEQMEWCTNNTEGDVKTSTGQSVTSFYFMNSFDAMAFKLAFSDLVVKTLVANPEKAAILLEERMEKSIREYHEYLEGENDGK